MKKAIIIIPICLVLIAACFVWFKLIKQSKHIAGRDNYIIDGSDYVESGEYYFNCNNGFFVKRIPPELDMVRLKKGKIIISDRVFKKMKPVLESYIQTPGWETDFEYMITGNDLGLFRAHPARHYFDKYIEIDGKDYTITIVQPIDQNFFLDILIYEGHNPGANGETYLKHAEKAKNSCPDPQ